MGKRKAPETASSGKKAAAAGGSSKKARQQQPDASQRSITAFFSRSPSGKAAAPVPVQHREPADPEVVGTAAVGTQTPRAAAKLESAAEVKQEPPADVEAEPAAEQPQQVRATLHGAPSIGICEWSRAAVCVVLDTNVTSFPLNAMNGGKLLLLAG